MENNFYLKILHSTKGDISEKPLGGRSPCAGEERVKLVPPDLKWEGEINVPIFLSPS